MSLDQGDFFFSYDWDLTSSMQKQIPNTDPADFAFSPLKPEKNNENSNKEITMNDNDRFIWNTHILQPVLRSTENFGLILPIINGSFCQKNIELEGREVSIILISRRSRFNAGARYLKRGINFVGEVANEVETEQILLESNDYDPTLFKISSFVHV